MSKENYGYQGKGVLKDTRSNPASTFIHFQFRPVVGPPERGAGSLPTQD